MPKNKRFDLDSEAVWQAYKIANVFLVWDAKIPHQKRTAEKIIQYVIKQWYSLGRRHKAREIRSQEMAKVHGK